MESELHDLRQRVRDLDEELASCKAESRAQSEKAAKLTEQQRREVHDANLELGRLRVRLEERQWQVQKLEAAVEAVQHKGQADKDVTQHLRDSLAAAGKEIDTLRRERDALVKEGRETEERLQAQVGKLQARVEEEERVRRDGRRSRAESALASLGQQISMSLQQAAQQRDEEAGEEEDCGDCQSDDGADVVDRWSTPANPWHRVARLLGDRVGGPGGWRGGGDSGPPSVLQDGRANGNGNGDGESMERRARETLTASPGMTYVTTHTGNNMLNISGDYERGGAGQRRQRLASEPLASVCIRGGRVPSAQGPRSVEVVRAVSRGGMGTRGSERPQSVSMRGDRDGRRRGEDGQEEDEDEGLGSGRQAFGCWDGPQSGETDDTFACGQADHAAPPLDPPVPPLPSLSSSAQPVRQRRREGEEEKGRSMAAEQASLASRRRRSDTADSAKRLVKTKRKMVPLGKGQGAIVPANTLTAARLRQAVTGAANAGKAMRRAASLSQSSNGSVGRLTPRSVSSHVSGPKVGAKPLTAAAQRRNSAALSVPRASTRDRERDRLPKVHL